MNQTMLIGKAGGEVSLTVTPKGTKIANFSIATDKRYKDKEGNSKKITDWHNIAVFGNLADVVVKYVTKGTSIYVSGTLHNQAWTDKENKAQVSSTLHVEQFEIISGAKKKTQEQQKAETPKTPAIGDTCPKCNKGKIVKKNSAKGEFLSCDAFPACKNTYNIAK